MNLTASPAKGVEVVFVVAEANRSLAGLPGFQGETAVTNLTASPAREVEVVLDVLEPKKSLAGLPGFQSETVVTNLTASPAGEVEAVFDVLDGERLLQQRVVAQIDHADREVVARAPPGVHAA